MFIFLNGSRGGVRAAWCGAWCAAGGGLRPTANCQLGGNRFQLRFRFQVPGWLAAQHWGCCWPWPGLFASALESAQHLFAALCVRVYMCVCAYRHINNLFWHSHAFGHVCIKRKSNNKTLAVANKFRKIKNTRAGMQFIKKHRITHVF